MYTENEIDFITDTKKEGWLQTLAKPMTVQVLHVLLEET